MSRCIFASLQAFVCDIGILELLWLPGQTVKLHYFICLNHKLGKKQNIHIMQIVVLVSHLTFWVYKEKLCLKANGLVCYYLHTFVYSLNYPASLSILLKQIATVPEKENF